MCLLWGRSSTRAALAWGGPVLVGRNLEDSNEGTQFDEMSLNPVELVGRGAVGDRGLRTGSLFPFSRSGEATLILEAGSLDLTMPMACLVAGVKVLCIEDCDLCVELIENIRTSTPFLDNDLLWAETCLI